MYKNRDDNICHRYYCFCFNGFLSMSDSKSPEIANSMFFLLKNILSFPLSLLNNNLPFYLECREFPQYIFISVPINIILQSILCFLFIKLLKWGIQTLNNK